MKIKKYLLALIAPALLAAPGCSDNNDPDVELKDEPTNIRLSSENPYVTVSDDGLTADVAYRPFGGTVVIRITATDRNFTLSASDDSWFDWDAEYDLLTITAYKNYSQNELSGRITVTADGKSAYINVSQAALGEAGIMIEPSQINFTAGGTIPAEIEVSTNNALWDFEINCQWLLVEKTDNKLIVTADPNPESEKRSAQFEVVSTVGSTTERETVYVTQDAKASLELAPAAVSFYKDGGTVNITVTTNHDSWEFTPIDESWVTVSRSGNSLTVIGDPIGDEDSRSASFTVSTGTEDNTVEMVVFISQSGIDVTKMMFELTVTEDALLASIPIYGDIECTVDWGDGTTETITNANPTHTYPSVGVYNVTVDGKVTQLSSAGMTSAQRLNLTKVLQWGETGLVSMANGFGNCMNLASIPTDLTGSFKDVTTFYRAFYYCHALEEIPEGIFDYCTKCTTFEETFNVGGSSSTTIERIPENLFANCPDVTTFYMVFYGLNNVTTVSENLFANNTKVTDMGYVFYRTSLTEIPENIFANNTEVTTFLASLGQTAIEVVPGGLFANNTKADDFRSTFTGCSHLREVEAGIFDNNTLVTNFYNLFASCTSLEILPDGLFEKNTLAENFYSTFNQCKGLKRIPDGLFKNNTNATSFRRTFYNCESLEELPADMFNAPKATGANNTGGIFYGCASLKEVPEGLFDSFENATIFNEVFRDCTSLEKIPESLFDKNQRVNNVNNAFYNCESLKEIPAGLFDKNRAIVNFTNVFNGCTSVTGESPYSVIGSQKVHLYERSGNSAFTAPTSFSACFRGCEGLTDYDDILSTWK